MLSQERSTSLDKVPIALWTSLPMHKRKTISYSVVVLAVLVGLLLSYLAFNPNAISTTLASSNTQKPQLGINAGASADLFTDAMKTARITWDAINHNGDATLDSNGWPAEDAGVYVWESKANNNGTYKLFFNGQADVTDSFNYASFSDVNYDQATNTTTATLVITDTGSENFHLNFKNTKRTPTSALNTGVTNIRLYKPTAQGSTTPYDPSVIFTTEFVNAVAPYQYVRWMGGTNWNTSEHWSDRTRVDSSTQHPTLPGEQPFEGNQIAFEYMVAFSNLTQKDLYVLVPDRVDDDYVTKLAQLIRYGSDGTTPYTKVEANPVWKPLDAKLHVYVEYSNETWNFSFGQTTDIYQASKAEGTNNPDSPLNFDHINDENVWRFRYPARRTKEISDLFRGVFGNAAMNNRVRPLFFWQYNNLNGTTEQALQFLNDYYNNADGIKHVAQPHPPSYYLWGGGGAVYYHSQNDNAGSVDGIYASGFPETGNASVTNAESTWAHLYGLRYMAYEGGIAVGGDNPTRVQTQARYDARAKQTMIDSFNQLARAGGVGYTAGTYSQWQDIHDAPNSPRVQAAKEITSSAYVAPAITLGTGLNVSNATIIAGTHYSEARSWPSGASSNLGKETGYLLRADSAGTYSIALDVSNKNKGGRIGVYVDGRLLCIVSVPKGTSRLVAGTTLLTAGLHGVLLRPVTNATNGNAGAINALIVQPGSHSRPVKLPTATPLPTGWSHKDIGTVGQAGSVNYNNGTITINASGADITGTADAFHYAYKQVSGDGEVIARIVFEANSSDYAKPGVMIRDSLSPDAMHASMVLFPSLLGAFNARPAAGGDSIQQPSWPLPAVDQPYWVKITRQGNLFTGFVSADGAVWVQEGQVEIPMGQTVYAGLVLSAHDNSLLSSADFDNIALNGFTGVSTTPVVTPTPTPTPIPTEEPQPTPTPTPTPGINPTPGPVGNVPYLVNSGFETPDVGTGGWGSFQYSPTGSGWTFSAQSGSDGAGIAGNGSGFTSSNPNAPDGTQVAFIQGTGSIEQSVTVAADGSYKISFKAAQRGNVVSQEDFQVLIDGNSVGTFKPAGTNYGGFSTSSIQLAAGTHTVTFKGLNTAGGDNTVLFDSIVIS